MKYNVVLKKGKKTVKLTEVPKIHLNTMKSIYYNKGYNFVSQKQVGTKPKKVDWVKKLLPF